MEGNGVRKAGPLVGWLHPQREDWHRLQTDLAELYVAGIPFDGRRFSRSFGGKKISLPTYPFQRRRHWAELATQPALDAPSGAGPRIHPLLGWRVHSAADPGLVQFEGTLNAQLPPFLADHRIGGCPMLPATAYLEMAAAAAREVEPLRETIVEDLSLEQPLRLPNDQPQIVQVALRASPPGWQIQWFSRPAMHDSSAERPQWTHHATARLTPQDDVSSDTVDRQKQAEHEELEQLQKRCPDEVPMEEFYQRLGRHGLQYGPSFQGLRWLWRGRWEVLGKVERLGQTDVEADRYSLYPPLVDSCLHVMVELMNQLSESEGAELPTFIPVGVERLSVFSRTSDAAWSYARLREDDAQPGADQYSIDIDVRGIDGSLQARIEGLQVRRVNLGVFNAELSAMPSADAAQTSITPSFDIGELRALSADAQQERIVQFLESELKVVLKLDHQKQLDPQKNLFDLGLDSLMMVELLYKINRTLQINLAAQSLIDNAAILPLANEVYRNFSDPALAGQVVLPQTSSSVVIPDKSGSSTLAAAEVRDDKAMRPSSYHELETRPPAPETTAPKKTAPERVARARVESVSPRSQPSTSIRLFCLDLQSGDASVYSDWPDVLMDGVEKCVLELPDSDGPSYPTSAEAWTLLVEQMADRLPDQLDRPFAFFGRGGGALLALDLALVVQDRFGLPAAQVFVAQACPSEMSGEATAAWRIPADDPDILNACSARPRPPLDCPLTVFADSADDGFRREEMQRWYRYTRASFRLAIVSETVTAKLQDPTSLLRTVGDELRLAVS